jgi:hypothetical protein
MQSMDRTERRTAGFEKIREKTTREKGVFKGTQA